MRVVEPGEGGGDAGGDGCSFWWGGGEAWYNRSLENLWSGHMEGEVPRRMEGDVPGRMSSCDEDAGSCWALLGRSARSPELGVTGDIVNGRGPTPGSCTGSIGRTNVGDQEARLRELGVVTGGILDQRVDVSGAFTGATLSIGEDAAHAARTPICALSLAEDHSMNSLTSIRPWPLTSNLAMTFNQLRQFT